MSEFYSHVPFFPAPYPGESYYSVLCRYHLRSGNASAIHTQSQLFGHGINLFQTLLVPVCLHLLNRRVLFDNSLDPRSFALKNTALPLSFLNKLYVEKLPDDLAYDHRSPNLRCFCRDLIQTSSRKLRFCRSCAREQQILYGESYWQILPQLDGVEFCPIHKERIISSDCTLTKASTSLIPASAVLDVASHAEPECAPVSWYQESDVRRFSEVFAAMAEGFAWLLKYGAAYDGLWHVISRYRTILIDPDTKVWSDYSTVKVRLMKKHHLPLVNWLFTNGLPGTTTNYLFFGGLPIAGHVLMMVLLKGSVKRFMAVEPTCLSL